MDQGSIFNQNNARSDTLNAGGSPFASPRSRTHDNPPEVVFELATCTGEPNQTTSNNGVNGDSPESGSLYSDEIPSGYNSGEQYDTLSTGYMSGEAYELPDTRMELQEPALDVIEECLVPLDAKHDDPDAANIFVLPKTASMDKMEKRDTVSISSSSTETSQGDDKTTYRKVPSAHDLIHGHHGHHFHHHHHHHQDHNGLPGTRSLSSGSMKNKYRKKVTTFAIPIESAPLGNTANSTLLNLDPDDFGFDPESSDPGTSAPTGGYRNVPSDTDTSAFDSDHPGQIASGPSANQSDSGTELLHMIPGRGGVGRASAAAVRKAKRMRKHDEQWFMANDNKYWVAVRLICFWGCIAAMIGATIAAGFLIFYMPRTCNPDREWFQGTVFVDMKPASKDGLFRLEEEMLKLSTLGKLGTRAIHMKNLSGQEHVPSAQVLKTYETIFNASEDELIDKLRNFVNKSHENDLRVVVQVPVKDSPRDSDSKSLSVDLKYHVSKIIVFWANLGVDGISLAGLEEFGADEWVARSIYEWRSTFNRYAQSHDGLIAENGKKKIMIAPYELVSSFDEDLEKTVLENIDLLDATIETRNLTNFKGISSEIIKIAEWDTAKVSRPWINWNVAGTVPLTKAALAFHFLLPGTISVTHRKEVTSSSDSSSILGNLTDIRAVAVPIFMNANHQRCDCPEGIEKEVNVLLKKPLEQVLQMERFYNRRHRYLLIANFGTSKVDLGSTTSDMYSGGELILDTNGSSGSNGIGDYVKLSEVSLEPEHAIVIKLPK